VTDPRQDAPRACRARVLVWSSPGDVAAELKRLRVDQAAADVFQAHAGLRVIKLSGVDSDSAQIVRRAMLEVGGQAAVCTGASSGGADCLLAGTPARYRDLNEKLTGPPLGQAQLAAEIHRALTAFEHPTRGELRCSERILEIGRRTLIMGVINATPDSFSGDGMAGDVKAMVARGEAMAADGADILDVGGESTRPGAEPMPAEVETERVVPVIEGLAARVRIPISIDTYKSRVAEAALDAGAAIVNDITALRGDPDMAAVAADRGAPVIIMHMLGTPRTMQDNPRYDDLMGEIAAYLWDSVSIAEQAGVPRDQVVIDPGFGFGKTVQHNLEIVRRLGELKSLGQPVLLGPSRKSTIGKVLDLPAEERLEGTLALVALAVANGVDIVRVHDVQAAGRAARMADAVVRGWPAD
jgi:dihydropteroate synthase